VNWADCVKCLRNAVKCHWNQCLKVAHTRLPSVGFRSWSRFLAVSLQVAWVINPPVGCHYFPPGLHFWEEDCYRTASRLQFEHRPFCAWVQHANHLATEPPSSYLIIIILIFASCRWVIGSNQCVGSHLLFETQSEACWSVRRRQRNQLFYFSNSSFWFNGKMPFYYVTVLWRRRRNKVHSSLISVLFLALHSVIFFIPWELSTRVKK